MSVIAYNPICKAYLEIISRGIYTSAPREVLLTAVPRTDQHCSVSIHWGCERREFWSGPAAI